MEERARAILLEINRRFYTDFSDSFASTRRRIQPGVRALLGRLPDEGEWLDLGCGSGWLAVEWRLARRKSAYLGLDFSAGLLEQARREVGEEGGEESARARFGLADFSQAGWSAQLPQGKFSGAVCFAVLHHLPGSEYRLSFLRETAGLLATGSPLALSVWQFQNSPKLMARQVDWGAAGLSAGELEAGDTLLDWRQDPGRAPGLRYAHLFSAEELENLGEQSGFEVVESFESDGAGGRLSLYQVWKKQ